MKARKFTIRPIKAKFGVYCGGVLQVKVQSEGAAAYWIGRQTAEDHDTRFWKVAQYLLERKARAPVAAEPTDQLSLL
ncbi:MAG: hypothetical protein JWN75_1173 [Candidatus Saccharibacteria bacterium]|nr:hypothetical protein [Candidatus Saccharibacteria bacterium]